MAGLCWPKSPGGSWPTKPVKVHRLINSLSVTAKQGVRGCVRIERNTRVHTSKSVQGRNKPVRPPGSVHPHAGRAPARAYGLAFARNSSWSEYLFWNNILLPTIKIPWNIPVECGIFQWNIILIPLLRRRRVRPLRRRRVRSLRCRVGAALVGRGVS